MDLGQLTSTAATKHVHQRSALNPILWLSGIVTPVALGFAWMFQSWPALAIAMTALAFVPVLVAAGVYIYFAIENPGKLQSEDFQIRQEALQIVRQSSSPIRLKPASIDALLRLEQSAPTNPPT